jgi:tripartite ATP-independent transporter DctP family solute receptor
MRHRSHLRARAVAALLAAAALGLAAPDLSAQVVRLRLAELHPDDHPTTKADYEFARLVSERSQGRIKITVYTNSVLGQEVSVLEQVQFGAIDMARVSLAAVATYVPDLAALQMPYLYRDEAHMWRVLGSEVGRELLRSVSKAGFVGLCFFEAGERSLYNSRRPIRAPADLAGLRIRVQESTLMADTMTALGARPFPMAFGETYSALETGLVDGAENNLPTYFTSLHYKVAGYYTLTRHARIPEIVVGSSTSFAALSEEDRALIAKAADDVVGFQREAWREYESQSARRIALSGVSVITPADLEPWKRLAAAVYARQPAEIRDYVARIKAVK